MRSSGLHNSCRGYPVPLLLRKHTPTRIFSRRPLDDARLYKLELEYNVSESNKRWLRETLPAWRQECAIKTPDGLYVKKHQRSRSVDGVDRHSWTQLFVVHMEEDAAEEETDAEDKIEDLTIHETGRRERTAARRAAWRRGRGRRASVLFPIWEEEIQLERCEVKDLQRFEPEMPALLTPLPEFGLVAANDDGQDDGGEHERDGEHELDVGDTLSVDDVLSLNPELPAGTSSMSAFLDGFSSNDMEMDIEPLAGEDLAPEFEGNEDAEGAETEKNSSPFAFKLSRSERERHIKLLEEDSTLEKKWRLTLLQSQPWLDTDSATRPAKRAREDSSSRPARKANKLDPNRYERSQEPLVFPGCYLPSMDKELTLKVYGLQSTVSLDCAAVRAKILMALFCVVRG